MRGRHFVACAVREPKGDIVVTSEPLSKAIYASDWAKIPFLRAVTILWDTLVLGTKMLMYSANIAVAEEDGGPKKDQGQVAGEGPSSPTGATAIPAGIAFGTLAVSLAFGIGLFFVIVPTRKALFNTNGPALGVLLFVVFATAFAGGYFFKGKSGWCSSFRFSTRAPAICSNSCRSSLDSKRRSPGRSHRTRSSK